jgi:hypothetical protein
MTLKAAFGRGNRIRLAWIGFQRTAKRAGDRFKGRFRNMVAIDAMQFIDMQGDAAVGGEGLKKFTHQFCVESADFLGWQIKVPNQIGTAREIERAAHQSVIHSQQAIAVAPNAALVAESLRQGLTQGDAHIFDRMMVINVQISGAAQGHVDQSMTGQLIEHVIEKADAGLIVIEAAAIEIELN